MELRDPSLSIPPLSDTGAALSDKRRWLAWAGVEFPCFLSFPQRLSKAGRVRRPQRRLYPPREGPDLFPLYPWVHPTWGPRDPGTGLHSAASRPGKRSWWLHSFLARPTGSGRFYRPPFRASPARSLGPMIIGKGHPLGAEGAEGKASGVWRRRSWSVPGLPSCRPRLICVSELAGR